MDAIPNQQSSSRVLRRFEHSSQGWIDHPVSRIPGTNTTTFQSILSANEVGAWRHEEMTHARLREPRFTFDSISNPASDRLHRREVSCRPRACESAACHLKIVAGRNSWQRRPQLQYPVQYLPVGVRSRSGGGPTFLLLRCGRPFKPGRFAGCDLMFFEGAHMQCLESMKMDVESGTSASGSGKGGSCWKISHAPFGPTIGLLRPYFHPPTGLR